MKLRSLPTLLVLVGAACGSFTSADGAGPDVPAEAGTEDGGADAASDVSLADGAIPITSFCAGAGTHTFCEDFDTHDLEAGGWVPGERHNIDAGTLVESPAIHQSSPNALSLDMISVPHSGLTDATLWLQHSFTEPGAKRVVLSMGLWIDDLTPVAGNGGGFLGGRVLQIAIDTYLFELAFSPQKPGGSLAATIYEGSIDGSVPFTVHAYDLIGPGGAALVTRRAWHRVQLALDLEVQRVALMIDDLIGVENGGTAYSLPGPAPLGIQLRLGAKTDAPTTHVAFDFDDLTLDLPTK